MNLRRSSHAAFGILLLSAFGAYAGCDDQGRLYPPPGGGAPGTGTGTTPDEVPPDIGELPGCAAMPACDSTITIDPAGSALLIRDPAALAKVPLDRVIQQINQLAGVNDTATGTMQRLFDTMNTTAGGKLSGPFHCDDPSSSALMTKTVDTFTCPRAEGALATSQGFFTPGHPDHFYPVAIINRFDLTPLDGTRCGQYRIIYAKESGLTDPNNRVFLIFEGALASPMPGCLESCRPVAEYLEGLQGKSSADLAGAIDHFFFEGLDGFGPVVHPMSYGLAGDDQGYGAHEGGQVRVSMHMEDPWIYREFRLGADAAGGFGFVPATVKNNPVADLFDPESEQWPAVLVREQLIPQSLPMLASAELSGIQMFPMIETNAVESVIDGAKKNDYHTAAMTSADTSFADSIDSMLAAGGYGADCPPDDPLDAEAILMRATALSCGGCHVPSKLLGPDRSVGCGLIWPESIGTSHVTEKSEISPALQDVFLPHRAEVLQTYLQACDPAAIDGSFQSGGPGQTLDKRVIPASRTLGGSSTH